MLVWGSQIQTYAQDTLRFSIERMVIDPLSDFGVITRRYQTQNQDSFKSKKLSAFQITRFGRNLLETLVYPGRLVGSDY